MDLNNPDEVEETLDKLLAELKEVIYVAPIPISNEAYANKVADRITELLMQYDHAEMNVLFDTLAIRYFEMQE